jgi:hypothetical protein
LGASETGFAVADKLLGFHAEMIGSFHEGNEKPILGGNRFGSASGRHEGRIVVITIVVKR